MQSTETKEKILAAAGKYLGRYFTGKRSETDSGAVKRYLSQAALGVFDCGIAFLIASAKLKSGIMPFGSALLCASEKRVPFIFAGLALSAFVGGESAMINIVTYSAALVIRLLLCFLLGLKRGQLFTEPEPFRLSAAAASGFIAGIYSVFGGGFTKASLVSALMLIPLTPALRRACHKTRHLRSTAGRGSAFGGIHGGAGAFGDEHCGIFAGVYGICLSDALRGGCRRGLPRRGRRDGLRACLLRVALSRARDRRGDRRNSAAHRNGASDACLLRMRDGIFACSAGI